ncbi:hypothetical protein D3C84_1303840 [compost metagenome]
MKVISDPSDSTSAREKFSSSIGPSTKPSTSGAGSNRSTFSNTPIAPNTAVRYRSNEASPEA